MLVDILPDDRFLCSILEFQTWAQARSELTMEFFYRDMRRKTSRGIRPEGGGQRQRAPETGWRIEPKLARQIGECYSYQLQNQIMGSAKWQG